MSTNKICYMAIFFWYNDILKWIKPQNLAAAFARMYIYYAEELGKDENQPDLLVAAVCGRRESSRLWASCHALRAHTFSLQISIPNQKGKNKAGRFRAALESRQQRVQVLATCTVYSTHWDRCAPTIHMWHAAARAPDSSWMGENREREREKTRAKELAADVPLSRPNRSPSAVILKIHNWQQAHARWTSQPVPTFYIQPSLWCFVFAGCRPACDNIPLALCVCNLIIAALISAVRKQHFVLRKC